MQQDSGAVVWAVNQSLIVRLVLPEEMEWDRR